MDINIHKTEEYLFPEALPDWLAAPKSASKKAYQDAYHTWEESLATHLSVQQSMQEVLPQAVEKIRTFQASKTHPELRKNFDVVSAFHHYLTEQIPSIRKTLNDNNTAFKTALAASQPNHASHQATRDNLERLAASIRRVVEWQRAAASCSIERIRLCHEAVASA